MSWRPDKSVTYHNIGTGIPSAMPSILFDTMYMSKQAMVCEKEFFSGACYTCAAMPSVTKVRLRRCAGCQLVSYCNKNCQVADWKQHKIVCKKFPVENGKNVIVRKTESIGKDHRNKQPGTLYDPYQAAMWEIQLSVVESRESLKQFTRGVGKLFLTPRVCSVCREARPEMLMDCRCCTASYCSKAHRMQDTRHLTGECDILYDCAMINWYLTQHHQLQIPDGLLNEVNLNDGLKFEKVSKLAKYSNEKWLEAIVNLINERLSFPLTIHHALKNRKLGEQRKTLSEFATLTIHIVQFAPMLDPRIWEFFLHQLPNLKTLNLSFINGGMKLDTYYNSCLPVERCSDCNRKQRVINYNIHPMHYHEYFSSDDYVQPDVVAVFGTSQELMDKLREKTRKDIDKAHIFTSQRNMTYGKHTVVILTDSAKDHLEACVKSFHDTRPVNILLPVQDNPVRGFSTSRCGNNNFNQRYSLCCIQGKH